MQKERVFQQQAWRSTVLGAVLAWPLPNVWGASHDRIPYNISLPSSSGEALNPHLSCMRHGCEASPQTTSAQIDLHHTPYMNLNECTLSWQL